MNDIKQPEAMRWAHLLETTGAFEAAAELRLLHSLNQELLEALKDCLAKGSRWHPCDPVVAKAKAAITKATGEQA